MDSVFASIDSPRPRAVHGAKTALRRVPARNRLLRARQDRMKRLAIVVLLTVAAKAQTQSTLPKVLRIVRESIKPGKAAAQEKIRSGTARAMVRFKYPANFLALSAVSGDSETWVMEAHDSFASIENADTFIETTAALKWWLGQYEAQDGEVLASSTRLLAVYRPDLSYRGEQA